MTTEQELLDNIHSSLEDLKTLLGNVSDHWGYEDPIYRFYHQSFKVHWLQDSTRQIVNALEALAPDLKLDPFFNEIIKDGTGHKFQMDHNDRWTAETRPIVEAFFHARYMLEMAVRWGEEQAVPPELLPSGWAAVLSLYGLR